MPKKLLQKMRKYKDTFQKENTDFFHNEFNMLSIHEQLSKLHLNITQMDFDATISYPPAMWDIDSVYPETESG